MIIDVVQIGELTKFIIIFIISVDNEGRTAPVVISEVWNAVVEVLVNSSSMKTAGFGVLGAVY